MKRWPDGVSANDQCEDLKEFSMEWRKYPEYVKWMM